VFSYFKQSTIVMDKKPFTEDYKIKFLECDDKFNTIFKLTSAASKIIAPDLTILKVNDALADLLGYRPDEIEGTQILDYACEEYKPHWHDLQDALWKRKVPYFKLQVCLTRKNGLLAWVDVTTVLFKDSGKTYGFTVLDDITGQKQYEQTQKRLTTALRNARLSVWETDADLNMIFRSEGHDAIFGYDWEADDWSMQKYADHLLESDRQEFAGFLTQLKTVGAASFQGRIITVNNTVKWIALQAKAEYDQSGIPLKYLGTIADVTLEKQKERHKEDFISIASHELKTPVTGLKASLQLLGRLMDNQDQ